MKRKKKVIEMEMFIEVGDKYIGYKSYKITSEFEQYHYEMACYPISININVIHPYKNISVDFGIFGIFVSVGVGKLG